MAPAFFPASSELPDPFAILETENRGRVVTALNQLEEISNVFAQKQVQWVLVKGVGLALSEYDNPFVRPFGDLDIFVLPGHFGHAVQALLEAGYHTSANPDESLVHWTFTRPQAIPVELHYRFSRECSFPAHVLTSFVSQRVILPGCGFDAFIPAFAHHLAYVLLHAYNHGWQLSGFWVQDVRLLIRNHPEICSEAMNFFPEPSPVGISMDLAMRTLPEPMRADIRFSGKLSDSLLAELIHTLLQRCRFSRKSSGAVRILASPDRFLTLLSMLVR